MLKLAGIPFIGSGVLGSAIGLDKGISKKHLRDAGFRISQFIVASTISDCNYVSIDSEIGNLFFVKPANIGSSIGIDKVHNEDKTSSLQR